jgi:hypothetical protein
MATFDFQGGDVASTGFNYGDNVTHGTNTTWTEGGISFSLSSTAQTDHLTDGFDGAGALSASTTATGVTNTIDINVVDTDASQTHLDNVVVSFSSVSESNGGQITVTFHTISGSTSQQQVTANNNYAINGNTYIKFTAVLQNVDQITITTTGSTIFELHAITGTPNCFMPGTLIATADGEAPVETLKAGDMVRTADGRLTPVTWLGEQSVNVRLQHPAKVNPVCIRAGALGGGLPVRDLHLSPDHAIEIDGVLYNAGALVNGSTIYQMAKMPMDGFTYYHIETEAHELLVAEGVSAESYIDYDGRAGFDNAAEADGRTIAEMDLPRVSSARLVPDDIRERLAPLPIAAE